jgi:hypothetical protein
MKWQSISVASTVMRLAYCVTLQQLTVKNAETFQGSLTFTTTTSACSNVQMDSGGMPQSTNASLATMLARHVLDPPICNATIVEKSDPPFTTWLWVPTAAILSAPTVSMKSMLLSVALLASKTVPPATLRQPTVHHVRIW